jgi:hypothetical protein
VFTVHIEPFQIDDETAAGRVTPILLITPTTIHTEMKHIYQVRAYSSYYTNEEKHKNISTNIRSTAKDLKRGTPKYKTRKSHFESEFMFP